MPKRRHSEEQTKRLTMSIQTLPRSPGLALGFRFVRDYSVPNTHHPNSGKRMPRVLNGASRRKMPTKRVSVLFEQIGPAPRP